MFACPNRWTKPRLRVCEFTAPIRQWGFILLFLKCNVKQMSLAWQLWLHCAPSISIGEKNQNLSPDRLYTRSRDLWMFQCRHVDVHLHLGLLNKIKGTLENVGVLNIGWRICIYHGISVILKRLVYMFIGYLSSLYLYDFRCVLFGVYTI